MKNIFILVIHFQISQVFKVSYNVDLLPTNAKRGRIMRIMKINIWLLEALFIVSIQIFDINITIIGSVQKFVWNHKNDFQE